MTGVYCSSHRSQPHSSDGVSGPKVKYLSQCSESLGEWAPISSGKLPLGSQAPGVENRSSNAVVMRIPRCCPRCRRPLHWILRCTPSTIISLEFLTKPYISYEALIKMNDRSKIAETRGCQLDSSEVVTFNDCLPLSRYCGEASQATTIL